MHVQLCSEIYLVWNLVSNQRFGAPTHLTRAFVYFYLSVSANSFTFWFSFLFFSSFWFNSNIFGCIHSFWIQVSQHKVNCKCILLKKQLVVEATVTMVSTKTRVSPVQVFAEYYKCLMCQWIAWCSHSANTWIGTWGNCSRSGHQIVEGILCTVPICFYKSGHPIVYKHLWSHI